MRWFVFLLLFAVSLPQALAGPERAADPTKLRDVSGLIVVICEDGGKSQTGRALDRFGRIAIAPFVRPFYKHRTWLVGKQATRGALLGSIREMAKTAEVIDVVMFIHGNPGKNHLADGVLREKELIAGLKGRGGAKLRMVYTTACYSETMLAAWHQTGAYAVRGMTGVNRPLDFPRFMLGWLGGEDYATANQRGLGTNASLHRLYNLMRPRLMKRLKLARARLDKRAKARELARTEQQLRGLLGMAVDRWFKEPWDLAESTPRIHGADARIDRLPPRERAESEPSIVEAR